MSGKEEEEEEATTAEPAVDDTSPTCTVGEVWVVSWWSQQGHHIVKLFDSWQLAYQKLQKLYPGFKKKWEADPYLLPMIQSFLCSFDTLQEGDSFKYPDSLYDGYKLDMRKKHIKGLSGRRTKRARAE